MKQKKKTTTAKWSKICACSRTQSCYTMWYIVLNNLPLHFIQHTHIHTIALCAM